MPALKCIEIIESKLKFYGLSLNDDIVSITTDGAAVMKKVVDEIKPEQQLCLAHGIQLAVIEVLYPKQKPLEIVITGDNSDSDSDITEELINLEFDNRVEARGYEYFDLLEDKNISLLIC